MAAENRCQGFYRLRIYHLTTGAICAPPSGLILVKKKESKALFKVDSSRKRNTCSQNTEKQIPACAHQQS